jgi:hypothetical protein
LQLITNGDGICGMAIVDARPSSNDGNNAESNPLERFHGQPSVECGRARSGYPV